MSYRNNSNIDITAISDDISESEKAKMPYLKANADYTINSLLYEKPHILKARNFYEGIRDEEEYAYLQERFGLSNPITLKFNHLMRPRINALIGQLTDTALIHKVSVNDSYTLDKIQEEKKTQKYKQLVQTFNNYLQNNLQGIKSSDVEKEIQHIEKRFSKNWLSSYQIAAQHSLEYFKKDNSTALLDKINRLATDLCVTGEAYFRSWVDEIGKDPQLEVCNPSNIFFAKNNNTTLINECDRVVYREFLTRQEVIKRYGHLMTKDEREKIMTSPLVPSTYGYRLNHDSSYPEMGTNISSLNQYHAYHSHYDFNVIEVFHVEWLANNKVGSRYRLDRYHVTKIGWDIYVNAGKDDYVLRDVDKPWDCKLTYNGLRFNDENGTPFSMVLKTKDLQDKYDLLHYFRDNLIATSGGKGSRINIPDIPKWMGKTPEERLLKYIQYLKQGVEVLDTSQDGTAQFNNYGTFDHSLDGRAIAAIDGTIKLLEQNATFVSGTSPQSLGQIEEREAVSNVRVGIKQTSFITKPLRDKFRYLLNQLMTDMVNNSQLAWSDGKKGSYIIGDTHLVSFTLPEKKLLSSYNVTIVDDGIEEQKREILNQLSIEFVKNGLVSPDISIKLVSVTSLKEAEELLIDSMEETTNRNQQLQEMQQQIEQLTQQLQTNQKQLNQFDQLKQSVAEQKLKLEEAQLQETIRQNKVMEELKKSEIRQKEEAELMRNKTEQIEAMINPTNRDNEVVNVK